MKKKLLAILCACALTVALAVPAFAAMETKFTATTTIPDTADTVSIQVPATRSKLYFNLDGAPYDPTDATVGDYTVKGDTVTDAFFSETGLLVNTSETELDVKVSMTATAGGKVEIAASATGNDNIAPSGSLYVAEIAVSGTTATPDWDGAEDITIAATVGETAAGTLPAKGENPSTGSIDNGYFAYRLAGDLDIGST